MRSRRKKINGCGLFPPHPTRALADSGLDGLRCRSQGRVNGKKLVENVETINWINMPAR